MASVAFGDQALGRLPGLGRVVVHDLVGHDLVHRNVQFLAGVVTVVGEVTVFGLDEDSAVVLVVRVEQAQIEVVEGSRGGWEQPFFTAAAHGRSVCVPHDLVVTRSQGHAPNPLSNSPWETSATEPPDPSASVLQCRTSWKSASAISGTAR